MAKADARKAKEPPRQALDTIKRLSGAVLSSRDEQRLYDAHRAILRAYRALGGWRKDAAFSTWLFAVATNLYRTEVQRIPPRTISLDDVAEPRESGESHSGVDDGRDQAVRRAVLALPPKYRDTLTLFYFHEKDLIQAAQSLGVPEGTVKARLNRGREILRRKLPRLLAELNLKESQ